MRPTLSISVANHRRLLRAREWLANRSHSGEVLILGATLDGANEIARTVARAKGAAFGWHRLSFSQLA
jgi:hypothetical protein